MTTRYRPPRSGKRALGVTILAAFVAVGGVFAAIDRTSFVTRASSGAPPPPEETQPPQKSQLPYGPSPMPKALPPVVERKAVAARPPGPAIYKCQDPNGAVTYSQFPCAEGTFVDTRPTSSGFSDSWQTSVKRSERQ